MKLCRSLLVPMLLTASPANAVAMETRTIQVTIDNIEPKRGGQLILLVFSEQGFPTQHGEALSRSRLPVTGTTTKIMIEVPASGDFALNPNISSRNVMIVPGSSFRCGFAIESIVNLLMIEQIPQLDDENGARARSA